MRKLTIILAALAAMLPLTLSGQGIKQIEGSFLEPLDQRDSILIADQLRYGFKLDGVEDGTELRMQDWTGVFGDTLVVVRNWQVDTLKVTNPGKRSTDPVKYDISGDIILAPFEEGEYHLPPIAVQRVFKGVIDTLVFDPQQMTVTTIPVDTTTFVIHDIKGQVRYPLTFKETIPYILGLILLAALVVLIVYLVKKRRERMGAEARRDPAYIVALRKLDHFRGDKYWAPEKQKTFYSGITDTLREYIAETFDIDAREMTTAEIFGALKGHTRLSDDLYRESKDLFELADFVKFAKHVVGDEDNAKALPSAVRFITATYQETVEDEVSAAVENASGTDSGTEKKEA